MKKITNIFVVFVLLSFQILICKKTSSVKQEQNKIDSKSSVTIDEMIEFPSDFSESRKEYYKGILKLILNKDINGLFDMLDNKVEYENKLTDCFTKKNEKELFLNKKSELYYVIFDTENARKIEGFYEGAYSIFDSLKMLGNNKIKVNRDFRWVVGNIGYYMRLEYKKENNKYKISSLRNYEIKKSKEKEEIYLNPMDQEIITAIKENKPEVLIKYFQENVLIIDRDCYPDFNIKRNKKEFIQKRGIYYDLIFSENQPEKICGGFNTNSVKKSIEQSKSIRSSRGDDKKIDERAIIIDAPVKFIINLYRKNKNEPYRIRGFSDSISMKALWFDYNCWD